MNKQTTVALSAALASGLLIALSPAWALVSDEQVAKPAAASLKATNEAGAKRAGLTSATAQPEMKQLTPEEVEKMKAMKEAQEGDPANPLNAEQPKALQLSELNHDWGQISDDTIVNHTFKAKNISTKTVKLVVAASCGCTVSKLEKDTVEPGEEVPLTASFNPQGRSGQQTKTLTITVTEPAGEFAQQFITITSNVRPLMMVEPTRTFMQEVDHREGRQEKITVVSRKAGFEVTSVDSNSEFVKATMGPVTTSEENGETVSRTEITLDVGRGAPIGTLNSQITIKSNDAAAKPLSTFVGAEITGDVRANPASSMIRATAPGSLISAEVRVDTRSGKPFKVMSVDVETRHDMRLATDLKPASEDSTAYTVSVSGIAPLSPGLIQGTILVSTDSEGGETIRIPFTATVPRAQPGQQSPKVSAAQPSITSTNPSITTSTGMQKPTAVSLTPQTAPTKKQ